MGVKRLLTLSGGCRKIRNMKEKMFPVLVVVLIVMAFGMGAMWSKLQTTGQAPQARTGKYKSFEEAVGDMGKQAGVKDIKKLISCMNSGEKKTVVDADTNEGTGVGITGTPGFLSMADCWRGRIRFSSLRK